jgi:hypothetical protein
VDAEVLRGKVVLMEGEPGLEQSVCMECSTAEDRARWLGFEGALWQHDLT